VVSQRSETRLDWFAATRPRFKVILVSPHLLRRTRPNPGEGREITSFE
jgi:hypothetical protein